MQIPKLFKNMSLCKIASGLMLLLSGTLILSGCGKNSGEGTSDSSDTVVVVSPHNENIRYEFEEAFKEFYQNKFEKNVTVQWRDVGGSSSILQYLTNIYERTDTAGIDVVFGGGEYTFQQLDKAGLLVPLELDEDILANIPAIFGGMEMYNADKTWCGSVVSSFGFLYNKLLLQQMGIEPPRQWEDLASKEFYDLSMLADPTQSGSIAAAFEMIVQSEDEWPAGWQKLFSILSNAKKFTDTSGAAANAPVLGEAVVSVCIDFYGSMRVADAPDKLGYVSPKGQTGFTPDPIAVLRNSPNPQTAQRFINFLLSLEGQALWALPPEHLDGTKRYLLNRPPIRKDFYEKYDADIPDWIARPYAEGAEMIVDAELRAIRYGVLAQLVRAAAIDNLTLMKQAKRRLIASDFPAEMTAFFYQLPSNVDTAAKIYEIAEKLNDTTQAEVIVTDWTSYFRDRYKKIIEQ